MPVRICFGFERLRIESPSTTGYRPGLVGSIMADDAEAIAAAYVVGSPLVWDLNNGAQIP